MMRRVVVTGLGVVAPNAFGCEDFKNALWEGRSGLSHLPQLAELGFGCHVGGVPRLTDEQLGRLPNELRNASNECMRYAALAALEAWSNAGLAIPDEDAVDEDTGAIIGTGVGGLDTFSNRVYPGVAERRVKRLGSTVVEQIMGSGAAAAVSGLLGLGNQVFSNSSACSTGTEAIILGAQRIRYGLANRMLVGGTEGSDPHIWAGFDSMRVLNRNRNETPEAASRPLSATAGGFIPAAGSGVLVLEDLETAQARGARIYAELIGTAINSGGMRRGGSMTAPSPEGVQRCIRLALKEARLLPTAIDYINGHLTATMADTLELKNWSEALGLTPETFPWVNATKSLIGHSLGAAGGIEAVATLLQLHYGFIHASRNCEDFHPAIREYAARVPQISRPVPIQIAAKASFGFGDVNSCLIFRKWSGTK